MALWSKKIVKTNRGQFEVFMKGKGEPICVTHHYSEFNHTGDYFAETFTKAHKVFLVNLREAGQSEKAFEPYQLSMLETILDLEAIREALGYRKWGFAGHSTGGMLGILYGIYYSNKLSFSIIVGAAAREYATFSPNCIYHRDHPDFRRMQELMNTLSNPTLSEEQRKWYTIERTKLSLYEPEKYHKLFNLPISKNICVSRLHFFNRELKVFDVTKKLSLSTTPTLIICGKYDVQCPVEYSIEMDESLPNSQLVIFHASNHYPYLEEPTLFYKEFDSFLNELSVCESGGERRGFCDFRIKEERFL